MIADADPEKYHSAVLLMTREAERYQCPGKSAVAERPHRCSGGSLVFSHPVAPRSVKRGALRAGRAINECPLPHPLFNSGVNPSVGHLAIPLIARVSTIMGSNWKIKDVMGRNERKDRPRRVGRQTPYQPLHARTRARIYVDNRGSSPPSPELVWSNPMTHCPVCPVRHPRPVLLHRSMTRRPPDPVRWVGVAG